MKTTFRDRLLNELTELIPADPATPAAPTAVGPAVTGAPPRTPMRRRLILAATAAAVAASGLALVLPTLGGPAGPTPAWAIERASNDDVLVTVHEVDDPARLQADLRAAGVPAVVRAGSSSCQTWSVESEPELPDVLRADVTVNGDDHHWRIAPKALRQGHYLSFLIHRLEADPPGDDRHAIARTTSYLIIVTATDNPPCAPLPPPGAAPAGN